MTSGQFLHSPTQLLGRAGLYYQNMKAKLTFLLVPALAGALQFAPAVRAQPPTDKSARQFRMERRARWASLNEEERSKLRAAHQKAIADPTVRAARERLKQARQEFRDVMRPALLKADPSIQPILEKMRAQRAGRD
jgi:hypothetical protein